MKALIDSVKAYLVSKLDKTIMYAPLKADVLDIGASGEPKKSIAMRMIPSALGEQYLKGETIKKQFQILTKSDLQLEAMNAIEAITRELNNVHRRGFTSADGSFTLIQLNVYVEPNFVEKTIAAEYVYTALFSAELEMEGNK